MVRVAGRSLALPVAHVVETMRPLPIAPDGDDPALPGVAMIRGAACQIVALAPWLDLPGTPEAPRFVVVRTPDAALALLVDAVVAVRTLNPIEPVSRFAMRSTHPGAMPRPSPSPTRLRVLEQLRPVLDDAVWLAEA